MAKKEKKVVCEEMPPWLITFTDCMTLMLTFFVLLVSMAKVDERRKLIVLGSIIGTFGWHDKSYEVFSRKDTRRTVEPGPIDSGDLEPLKPLMWENAEDDLRFESNRFVQVLSVNADVLFAPASATLTPDGVALLDRIAPVLLRAQYPLLIAGHTSELRDELGLNYEPGDDERVPDLSWKLSLNRALAVYRHMLDAGMPADMLRLEGFGKYLPKAPQTNAENRRLNRRVDIVLDKRSLRMGQEVRELAPDRVPADDGTFDVDGFIFDLNRPGG